LSEEDTNTARFGVVDTSVAAVWAVAVGTPFATLGPVTAFKNDGDAASETATMPRRSEITPVEVAFRRI